MGHDKMDKHLKQKLEQRTIQPSLEAWGKLSNMLDEENQQTNKKWYYKYFVAASIVFLFGFFFALQFNVTEAIVIEDVVVEFEKEGVKSSVKKIVVTPVDSRMNNEVIIEKPKGGKYNNTIVSESFNVAEEARQKEEINVIKEKVNQYLAQFGKNKQEKLIQEVEEYDLDAEINALLAEATNNFPNDKGNNNSPLFQLDEETDMLLAAAFQELNFNPEEDTVNETLKNKLFKELEKGYFKSRMLLAERSRLTRP